MALFGALISPAHAYELANERWANRSCFSHDGSPELIAALGTTSQLANVTDCGYSANPDLRLEVVASFPGGESAVAERYATAGQMDHCVVKVAPQWKNDAMVILHETWHCLGMNHSDDPFAVMHWRIGASTRIRPDDVNGLQAIYGQKAPLVLRYGVYVGSVGRE